VQRQCHARRDDFLVGWSARRSKRWGTVAPRCASPKLGLAPLRDMIRAGAVLDVVGIVLTWVALRVLCRASA